MAGFAAIKAFISRLRPSGPTVTSPGLAVSFVSSSHFDDDFLPVDGFAVHLLDRLFGISVVEVLLYAICFFQWCQRKNEKKSRKFKKSRVFLEEG